MESTPERPCCKVSTATALFGSLGGDTVMSQSRNWLKKKIKNQGHRERQDVRVIGGSEVSKIAF